MKAVQLPGYPANRWLIDTEFSPWQCRVVVLRSHGINGEALLFESKADAETRITELQAAGHQAALDKHEPKSRAKPKIKDAPDD